MAGQAKPSTVHATCVAVDGRGVLITGASGTGKSDLALRLIDQGATLVADDRVALSLSGNRLIATAPDPLRGRLEVRGMGIVTLDHLASIRLMLAIRLQPAAETERLPGAMQWGWQGRSLPLIAVDPALPSAVARVRLAVRLSIRQQRQERQARPTITGQIAL